MGADNVIADGFRLYFLQRVRFAGLVHLVQNFPKTLGNSRRENFQHRPVQNVLIRAFPKTEHRVIGEFDAVRRSA